LRKRKRKNSKRIKSWTGKTKK